MGHQQREETSGEKYEGVPHWAVARPWERLTALEMPKSPNLTNVRSLAKKMFWGLRSRCRIWRPCTCCRATQICRK